MTESESAIRASNAPDEFTMNSITGKLVLSLVRGRDYAHAGEEEAIELALRSVAGTTLDRFLDVGCGIGGTARYVTEQNWGQVTGVDLDPANVKVANEHHPDLKFICADVVNLERRVTGHFDVIYLLNAFFLFPDQQAALRAMRAVATARAKLVIFDYVDRGGYFEWQPHRSTPALAYPIVLERIESELASAGWALERITVVHEEYLRWYETLVARIESKQDEIVFRSTPGFYAFALRSFAEMRDDIRDGRLGGAIIYASPG